MNNNNHVSRSLGDIEEYISISSSKRDALGDYWISSDKLLTAIKGVPTLPEVSTGSPRSNTFLFHYCPFVRT